MSDAPLSPDAPKTDCFRRYERCVVESGGPDSETGDVLTNIACAWDLAVCLKREITSDEQEATAGVGAGSSDDPFADFRGIRISGIIPRPSGETVAAAAQRQAVQIVSKLAGPTGPSIQEYVQASLILEDAVARLLEQQDSDAG